MGRDKLIKVTISGSLGPKLWELCPGCLKHLLIRNDTSWLDPCFHCFSGGCATLCVSGYRLPECASAACMCDTEKHLLLPSIEL